MERFIHKYIFYFFPKDDERSFFRFFPRVSDGKLLANQLGRKFDYQKLY